MALEHILTPFRIATLIGLFIVGLRIAGCSTLDQADLRAMDFRLLQRGALALPDSGGT